MKWGQHIFTDDEIKFANSKRNYERGLQKVGVDNTHHYQTVKGTNRVSESHNIHQLNKAIAAKQSHMSFADKLRNGNEFSYKVGRKIAPKSMEMNAKYHEDIARVAIQNGKRIADELFSNKVKLEEYNRKFAIYIDTNNNGSTYSYGEQRYFYNPTYQTKQKSRVYYLH